MENYLGEFDAPHVVKTKHEWAMEFIEHYGQIDGEHHKAWVLDQIARIMNDTPVIVKEARWGDKKKIRLKEIRFWTGEPSQKYLDWVVEMHGVKIENEDGSFDYEYSYDYGVAP